MKLSTSGGSQDAAPGMRQDVVERLPEILAYLRIHGVREQDVQDIAHDTVVVVCEAGDRLELQRVPKHVRQTARRLVRRFWRRGRLEDPGHDIDARPTDAHNPESMLREKEIRDLLARLLDELAPEQRAVIKQACLDGYLLTEIAEEQGISYDTVRSRYRLGLEELERAACRHRARQRRGNDPLPVVPFWHRGRRESAAQPAAVVMGAVGGAFVTAVLLLGRPGAFETTAAAPASSPAAVTKPSHVEPPPHRQASAAVAPGAPVITPESVRQERPSQNAETALLRQAQRALAAGHLDEAARLLNEHARRYPNGQHAPERANIVRSLNERKRTR
jgi:RNA polymerase sigma-70 factor (ECF subfamily)